MKGIKLGFILHKVTDFEYQNWITPRKAVEMPSVGGFKGATWLLRLVR
ncbi:hypothetical protein [Leptothermofonsia sp. ETS-13]